MGESKNTSKRASWRRHWAMPLALACLALLAETALFYYRYYSVQAGPKQPIPFSHRLHANVKQISCFFCHDGAIRGDRAAVPPLETCLLCHSQIITGYPYIVDLRRHYDAGEPVEWVRVNTLPNYVYFTHQVHLARGIDCGHCHGNVKEMDRITLAHDFKMGFCIQCHRDNHVTHDCFTCHR